MEEFVMDLLAFVRHKVAESDEKYVDVETTDEMTEEEKQEFDMAAGENIAMAMVLEFILRRYDLYLEERKATVNIENNGG